ncbi:WapI family immunity protein [Brevibacillus sp. TJ4]|uniref:WapI family immunity protein n=1 Tax=Brevibacillus sp. TJ4 TaxID=3234853 RepID=UPI0037D17202
MQITISGREDTQIDIIAVNRSYPYQQDYWDGNWLNCEIKVNIPGYTAAFPADLRTDEFQCFMVDLISIDSNLNGTANFRSMDSYIDLTCKITKTGILEWECRTSYPPFTGANLSFSFTSDQSFLPHLIKQLEMLIETYPVIGNPND